MTERCAGPRRRKPRRKRREFRERRKRREGHAGEPRPNHLLAAALIALSVACTAERSPDEQRAVFCEALDRVNAGEVETAGLPELAGHAEVLGTLVDVAPDAIADDLAQLHGVFESWARVISGEHTMLDTFDELTDPSLATAQGRIGDYMAEHCGLRLGDGQYNAAPRPSAQDICPGWPRVGSPLTINNFPNLPDISGANYFGNDFLMSSVGLSVNGAFPVEWGGRVELRGRYPRSRYFAYHPNDMDLNNLETLRDVDLEPNPGSINPYRELAEPGRPNYYTARLVFTGRPENPEPNTSYVGMKKDGETTNRYLINMLRLYASDIGDGANSGGVPLPEVTIYDADGEVTHHFEECDLYAPGNEPLRSELRFPALPIADHRGANPPYWSTSSNFGAPSDTMANADVQYLLTVYSRRFGDIFVVRAKFLTAPDTRSGEPHSADDKDVRLYTLCTYNIWAGSAIDCMLDNELRVDEDGYYTLVISDAERRPGNLAAESATWIDWGPYLDGQLSYRYVYRENEMVQQIARGVLGKSVDADMRPYVPVAIPCTKATFEAGGWAACEAAN